ncbi:Protein of unknown function [Bacillus cytotoxicus]|nr:Protein of unknown function [Bacillus cytotoxicus]SCN33235.1 Protein of unknown function [Bacillus cytotoxicus]
MIQLLCM